MIIGGFKNFEKEETVKTEPACE